MGREGLGWSSSGQCRCGRFVATFGRSLVCLWIGTLTDRVTDRPRERRVMLAFLWVR